MRRDGDIELWQGLGSIPDGLRSSITIGVFDGVHRGHQALMREVVAKGRELGVKPVVVTFDPHPLQIIAPGNEPALITTLRQRARVMESCGVEALLVLRFDEDLRQMPAEEFVRHVLVAKLGARHVVVGANFRFGYKQGGTIETLSDLGKVHGFGVTIFALQMGGQTEIVSSTLIRRHLSEGEIERVAQELDRPFRLEGFVERGAGRGRDLGFPTANLRVPEKMLLPKLGVYAGWAIADGVRHRCAINVGINPTFGDRSTPIVEAHLLDFAGDLYGKVIEIEFTHRLRDELKFDSVEALIDQVVADIARARELLRA